MRVPDKKTKGKNLIEKIFQGNCCLFLPESTTQNSKPPEQPDLREYSLIEIFT
jgi:hypothetical protein